MDCHDGTAAGVSVGVATKGWYALVKYITISCETSGCQSAHDTLWVAVVARSVGKGYWVHQGTHRLV